MNKYRAEKGTSLIEVLIYIAILSIIGTILVGYFMIAINSDDTHTKQNDISISASNISSSLKYDIESGINIAEPAIDKASSTSLIIISKDGEIRYYKDSNNYLIRESGSSTKNLISNSIAVDNIVFRKNEFFEERLNSTSTSIEVTLQISNRKTKDIVRPLSLSYLVGENSI